MHTTSGDFDLVKHQRGISVTSRLFELIVVLQKWIPIGLG